MGPTTTRATVTATTRPAPTTGGGEFCEQWRAGSRERFVHGALTRPRSPFLSEPGRHLPGRRQLDHADAADLRVAAYLGQRRFRRGSVEVQDGNRVAAGQLPAHRHLRDVDV